METIFCFAMIFLFRVIAFSNIFAAIDATESFEANAAAAAGETFAANVAAAEEMAKAASSRPICQRLEFVDKMFDDIMPPSSSCQ